MLLTRRVDPVRDPVPVADLGPVYLDLLADDLAADDLPADPADVAKGLAWLAEQGYLRLDVDRAVVLDGIVGVAPVVDPLRHPEETGRFFAALFLLVGLDEVLIREPCVILGAVARLGRYLAASTA